MMSVFVIRPMKYANLQKFTQLFKKNNIPDSPKLSISPSTHPVRQRALLTIFAKKNNVPIDPPSSGPNVLLIITVYAVIRK